MIKKPAKTQVEINEIIKNRWSPRAFDPNRRVSREQITAICEAARWAQSSMNEQPWNYIVWDRFHDESSWQKGFDCLVEWNQKWVQSAPVLMISLAKKHFPNGKFNRHHLHDTGAASAFICLQATALGLQGHQMGGFSKEKLMEDFNLSDDYEPMSMIAIGYQSEDINVIPEDYHEEELQERERNPLGTKFFDGQWGKPLNDEIA